MMYETLTLKPDEEREREDQELIEASRRDKGFVTIPKVKLREIQKIVREVGQYHIAAMIEDLLN